MRRSRISFLLSILNCFIVLFFAILLLFSVNPDVVELSIGYLYYAVVFSCFYFVGSGLAYTEKFIRGQHDTKLSARGWNIIIGLIILITPPALGSLFTFPNNPDYSLIDQFLLLYPFTFSAIVSIIAGIIYRKTEAPKKS